MKIYQKPLKRLPRKHFIRSSNLMDKVVIASAHTPVPYRSGIPSLSRFTKNNGLESIRYRMRLKKYKKISKDIVFSNANRF